MCFSGTNWAGTKVYNIIWGSIISNKITQLKNIAQSSMEAKLMAREMGLNLSPY